ENKHIVPTMSPCVMLRMRSSSVISLTHPLYVCRTMSDTRESAADGTDLPPRQGEDAERGSMHDVGALAHKHTYSASTQWGEGDDNSTTFATRYLEEVRRCSWHRCSEINARAMTGGTWQKRKAGLAKKNRRTMRRHTDLCLGQKLTYRTQQRIMRGAAL